MSGEDPSEAPSRRDDEEARLNRPYRRLVIGVFGLAVLLLVGAIYRGIIHKLDRLPTSAQFERPERVDDRALLACADDLLKLEQRALEAGGAIFADPGEDPGDDTPGPFEARAAELDRDRQVIVARCRLDESSDDPAQHAIAAAASHIEDLLRAYRLLSARFEHEGRAPARAARQGLEDAKAALRARR